MIFHPPGDEPGGRTVGERRPPARRWRWLLLAPLLGTLVPPLYDAREPALAGVPFFYWYQLAWIPLSALCTFAVYRAWRATLHTKGEHE